MSFYLPSPLSQGLPGKALAISEAARLASESVACPGMSVLAHYHSLQIRGASLHVKPATLEPVLLQPVHQPQLIVQLTGTTRLRLIRQGVASSY